MEPVNLPGILALQRTHQGDQTEALYRRIALRALISAARRGQIAVVLTTGRDLLVRDICRTLFANTTR